MSYVVDEEWMQLVGEELARKWCLSNDVQFERLVAVEFMGVWEVLPKAAVWSWDPKQLKVHFRLQLPRDLWIRTVKRGADVPGVYTLWARSLRWQKFVHLSAVANSDKVRWAGDEVVS